MNTLSNQRFTIVGMGNIGRILLKRLRSAGVPAERLFVCDSDSARGQAAAAQFGVRAVSLTDEATCSADALLLATPPQVVPEVLATMAKRLRAGQVIVSFAAAVPLARLEALAPPDVPVVRVMPSAPSLVGQGMNLVAYGSSATLEARALVEALLATLGETVVVRDEQMNWCVGLAGAAMRSVIPVLEGMTQAGIEAGLPAAQARRVAAQVILGTAALALQTESSFEELKALTPMQTVDEVMLSNVFLNAARGAKEKIDQLERKLANRNWET